MPFIFIFPFSSFFYIVFIFPVSFKLHFTFNFMCVLCICRHCCSYLSAAHFVQRCDASLLSQCAQIIPFYFPFMCNRMFSILSTGLNRMQWHKMHFSNGKIDGNRLPYIDFRNPLLNFLRYILSVSLSLVREFQNFMSKHKSEALCIHWRINRKRKTKMQLRHSTSKR